MNGIITGLVLQTGHLSPHEQSLAGCDHLADTKTLNASKQHYHKKSTDFGFAVNQRQAEVKSDYRKTSGYLDAEYHQPGDATTFKSTLNEYGKGGEVLGLADSGHLFRKMISTCRHTICMQSVSTFS
jgi:hypothetical protein